MRGAEQAVVHLKICLACVQISNSRVRVPKQHAPACVAGAGPWGAAVNQQRRRAKSSSLSGGWGVRFDVVNSSIFAINGNLGVFSGQIRH